MDSAFKTPCFLRCIFIIVHRCLDILRCIVIVVCRCLDIKAASCVLSRCQLGIVL